MKKFILAFVCSVSCIYGFAEKSKITIKNTFGGDAASLGEYDLFSAYNETDFEDNNKSEKYFALGDKFQFDFENDFLI